MLFKSPEIGLQLVRLHPKVRGALTTIDAQIHLWRLPQITITDISRTYAENVALYTHIFEKQGYATDEATKRAQDKRSFHLVDCAADFRSSGKEPYAPGEDAKIQAWLREQFPAGQWELITHDLGFGLHHHIAFRDVGKLRLFEQELRTA